MSRRKEDEKTVIVKKTSFFDFLIALGSGIVNLIKIEKIICIVILYLVGRDFYFSKNIEKGEVYQKNIMSAGEVIKLILNSGKSNVIHLCIILALVVIIIVLIVIIKTVYIKEINRLVKERKTLLHDVSINNFNSLKEHHSSEEV